MAKLARDSLKVSQAALRSSQSALAAAQAQLANAREQLGYTALVADAPGVITARQAEVQARLQNPDDEFYFPDATPEDLAAELEDRDYYKSANVFWVPEGARWETLRALAKNSEIGKFIDNATRVPHDLACRLPANPWDLQALSRWPDWHRP